MLPFITEFAVKPLENKGSFVAEVMAWLRGIEDSDVLNYLASESLDGENAYVVSPSGEELRIRELRVSEVWSAIGFRHDLPDTEGRTWRTEGVLRRASADTKDDLLRFRTECVARLPGVKVEVPKKPYLIKALLKSGWGGVDGSLVVSDQVIWLEDSNEDLSTAKSIMLGNASQHLPIVYISTTDFGSWVLNRKEIERLAYQLGGIAHVVAEPTRAFSIRLRDETSGRNSYGGTIGLSIPGKGIVRRYFFGWQISDAKELIASVLAGAVAIRGIMPSIGWDWTELQEQSLRIQRQRERQRLTVEESDKLYLEEIANLQDKIHQLEQKVDVPILNEIGTDEGDFSLDNLVGLIGPEIYSGEISDRLGLAVRTTLKYSETIGLDPRSKLIFERFRDRIASSPALSELVQDLSRASKDKGRFATEMTNILVSHGYEEKSKNKHTRLVAKAEFDGLESITLGNTPSDGRGLTNSQMQVRGKLGLKLLLE